MAVSTRNGTGIHVHNLISFRSTGRTGTGALETIKHNLGVTPTIVFVQPRDSASSVVLSATPADHDNIYVTVANAGVYDILALV